MGEFFYSILYIIDDWASIAAFNQSDWEQSSCAVPPYDGSDHVSPQISIFRNS